ncbi:Cytochrome P450 [Rhynchospora pubera]|uniref:Cytochrome P450 n=1 Tax=Rhynchospora pubera TaxID=906938 RepID=A0AAV8EGP4_9POAL|nr:Cytochrome P450 [Rhynchospora pubera]
MVFFLLSIQTLNYVIGSITLFLLCTLISILWISPQKMKVKLERNGFSGPSPRFPYGNLFQMTKKDTTSSPYLAAGTLHDIHAAVFPYFARWRKSFGNIFVYWLGTEPFLYIADPEFLKQVTAGILGKQWGKPNVFKRDRKPMFGNGLLMVEGNDWTHHRHVISPAFSMTNLNTMIGLMEENTNKMLEQWTNLVLSGQREIDVEKHVIENAAEIIAKTSFGINEENGKKVFEKLRAMQAMLFKTNRLVGVPFSKFLHLKQSYDAWKLGKEIDELLLAVIKSRRRRQRCSDAAQQENDLLGLMLAGCDEKATQERRLTTRELVDECKTFFFGGHETTALAISWTLLMLALHPDWQSTLREEVMEATQSSGELTSDLLSRLTKMGWVLNEVLRLYSPAPNVQRQAREDIRIASGDKVIPKGTNMWIDVVAMHHDPALWGPDVFQFRPERFADSIHGGCKQRMGFLPFGFGGRICVGRNLTITEYKLVLCLILRKFQLSVSPAYQHEPKIMLSLRPANGIQLILTPL